MKQKSRREALKNIAVGAAAVLSLPLLPAAAYKKKKTHFVTLSFDDGFKKSSIKTAEIFEKYKLSACINVIATGHHKDFVLPNEYHRWPNGDFVLWNELQDRGHEIMMHGYKHQNKQEMSFEQGKDSILRCIDVFSKELKGFEAKKSVFNFPFNATTPELEKWLPTQVLAYRSGGPAINPVPHKGQAKLTCTTGGPENIDKHLESEVNALLEQESGWLIYNTHGIDEESYGPVSSYYLEKLLDRLVAIESVEVIPAGRALANL